MRTPVPALMTDLYELTMAAGYWAESRTERAVFELFARRLPARRGYLVTAGIDAVADYLVSLRFTEAEIAYLRSLPAFAATPAGFFEALAELRFTGDMWAVREGESIQSGPLCPRRLQRRETGSQARGRPRTVDDGLERPGVKDR